MRFLRELGPRTIALLFAVIILIFFTVISFTVRKIGLPNLIIILAGSIVCLVLLIYSRKKRITREQKDCMDKAQCCIEKMEWANALDLFDKALFYDLKNYAALMGKGHCYRRKGDYRSAILQYKQVLKIKSDYTGAYFLLGVCYFEERFIDKALQTFQKLISIDPNFMEAYLFLGDLHCYRGENQKAEKCYRKYLEKCKENNIRDTVLEKLEAVSGKSDDFDDS